MLFEHKNLTKFEMAVEIRFKIRLKKTKKKLVKRCRIEKDFHKSPKTNSSSFQNKSRKLSRDT